MAPEGCTVVTATYRFYLRAPGSDTSDLCEASFHIGAGHVWLASLHVLEDRGPRDVTAAVFLQSDRLQAAVAHLRREATRVFAGDAAKTDDHSEGVPFP